MSDADLDEKTQRWQRLKDQAGQQLGPEMVYGEGLLDARFTIIGEAPGENEARAKRPFIGQAGRLLNQLLEEAGIDRQQVYVTNIVKLRPTNPGKGTRLRNRPPRANEIQAGLTLLLPELTLIAPTALILFGNVPAKALIDKRFAMGANRGQWFTSSANIPALATYHPAYLLRLQGPAFDAAKALVLSDLQLAQQALTTPPQPQPFG